MSEGIVYITAGEKYLEEAEVSAQILRSVMPEVSISIIADRPPNSELFDNYLELTKPHYGWMDKVENLHRSPYDKTIYFDSDIYVEKPFSELFWILDQFDMALVPDSNQHPVLNSKYNDETEILYSGNTRALTEFNAGVIAYRMTDSVRACLNDWCELYESENHWSDQPSLRTAISQNDVRVYPLRTQYNYMPGVENIISGEVKIFHNRLLDSSELRSRYKDVKPSDLKAVVSKVNNNANTARVTYPALGQLQTECDLVVRPPVSLPEYFYYSIKTRGVRGTIAANSPTLVLKRLYSSLKKNGVKATLKAVLRKARRGV